MKKLFRAIDSISDWSGKIVSFLIYAGILMLVFEVVSRYFFNSPTVWAHGYSQRLFGSYFVLVGAYTLLKDAHVRVDIIYQRFSIRVRAVLDIINYGLLILWTAVLFKEGITFFQNSLAIREVDEMALAHPMYPVKFLLVVGVALILLQGLSKITTSCITLVKGVKYES
ncbi:MAG: TRAP transporter small permease subunit [Desulfatitalea sp.]|nr:TRAP transporter small permease subunit [Desulfatitalea sp.]